MNKICVKINCYKGFSYEETLKGISDAGFRYVELSTSNGNSLGLSQDASIEDINKLLDDLHKYDLTPIAIGGNSFLMDEDTSKILKNVELANKFKCKYVDTIMFKGIGNKADDEDIINKIKFFIPYLKESNLDLVIELCGDYSTGKVLSNILDKVKCDCVHINYDTGNVIYSGGLSVDEMIKDFKENIRNVSFIHLKDKLDAIDVFNFPAIGKGYIPFNKIFDILKQNNNDSPLTVEIEFTEKGVSSVDEVNKALIDSYSYIKETL